jgi:2-hydroxy-3-keto-5-methylthiopentenyl-1-phosphate phosphatase
LRLKPRGVSGVKQERTDHIVHDVDGTVEKRTSYRNLTDSSTGDRDK